MFKVGLIDIGDNGCFCECVSPFETLIEAETLATHTIMDYFHTLDVELMYEDDLVYQVYADGRHVGWVAIVSL